MERMLMLFKRLICLFAMGFVLPMSAQSWLIKGTVYGGSNPLAAAKVTAFDATSGNTVGVSTTSGSGQ